MGKIVGAKDFKYPLNYDNIRIGWITDTELKIGDIVFKGGILEKKLYAYRTAVRKNICWSK